MNQQALDDFMTKTMEARELLRQIQAELDDHMNVNPEAINWGHVGDVNHVVASLRDIARFIGHEE